MHQLVPSYGTGFLDAMQSLYPGFHDARTMTNTLVGAGYGIVDGAIGARVRVALQLRCAYGYARGEVMTSC